MQRTAHAAKATFKKMQRKAHAAKQHNQTATKSPRRKIFRKPLRMRSVAEHLRRAIADWFGAVRKIFSDKELI